ncbi:MAG TPA: isochorismatase family cysteine hydrolase [Thermoanaerobaculia bacterium]|jgi:nicotinamidase-related amidase
MIKLAKSSTPDNATALLVVDMQNGFVNHNSEHIVPNIRRLLELGAWSTVVFTRFLNQPDSPYVRWIGWSRFMASPEIDIIEQLEPFAEQIVDKHGYSAFVPEVGKILENALVKRIVVCGVATDGCVLKTAVDAFERNIEPVVVADACASHAGAAIHDAALLLIPRFIGRKQVRSTDEVIAEVGRPSA